MFSPERTAQVCAEFVRRAGGSINVLKLVKLTYLCDRMSMERYAAPVTYDSYFSMDHGPGGTGDHPPFCRAPHRCAARFVLFVGCALALAPEDRLSPVLP